MPRFFAEMDQQGQAVIRSRDVHHIIGPLRKAVGDELAIRVREDGYMGRIVSTTSREIRLDILYSQELFDRSRVHIHLGMSLIDLSEMDDLLRSVTELGVSEVHPIIAARSNVREIREKRRERWQQIILEAVKQCERRTVPVIHEALTLHEFLRTAAPSWATKLVASLSAEISIRDCRAGQAGILIGPEGGFSADELNTIQESGFTPVHMGRTILRASTAATAAVGILAL